MDVFLIGIIAVGCLILFGVLDAATKTKGEGCLPLILLGLMMAVGLLALAILD